VPGKDAKLQSSQPKTHLMKFQRIEFSWRAAFVGFYLTAERDKLWVTILPFAPLYFKKIKPRT
jgi:hypothetical protein